MGRLHLTIGVALLLSSGAPVLAQSSGGGAAPPASGGESAPSQTAPQKTVPAAPGAGSSQNLSQTGGVIRPTVDPDPRMTKPAPNPGVQSMPVIPPPGTPGGNAEVQPK